MNQFSNQKVKLVVFNILTNKEINLMFQISLLDINESICTSGKFRVNIPIVCENEVYLFDEKAKDLLDKCNVFKKSVYVDFVLYENQLSITIETLML